MSRKLPLALTVLVGAALALPAWGASAGIHFELDRSRPEADATVPPPDAVVLWFTQVPQENSVSIRLVDADGEPVEAGDAVQDAEEPVRFTVEPAAPLAAGPYTVQWRGIGADGHTVRGSFGFTVSAR